MSVILVHATARAVAVQGTAAAGQAVVVARNAVARAPGRAARPRVVARPGVPVRRAPVARASAAFHAREIAVGRASRRDAASSVRNTAPRAREVVTDRRPETTESQLTALVVEMQIAVDQGARARLPGARGSLLAARAGLQGALARLRVALARLHAARVSLHVARGGGRQALQPDDVARHQGLTGAAAPRGKTDLVLATTSEQCEKTASTLIECRVDRTD